MEPIAIEDKCRQHCHVLFMNCLSLILSFTSHFSSSIANKDPRGPPGLGCVIEMQNQQNELYTAMTQPLQIHLRDLIINLNYTVFTRANATNGSEITNKHCPRINAATNQKNAALGL